MGLIPVLVLLNAAAEPVTFTIPDATFGAVWRTAINTDPTAAENGDYQPGDTVEVIAHNTVVLVCPREEGA